MGFQLPFPQLVFSPDVRTINRIGGPRPSKSKVHFPNTDSRKNLQVPQKPPSSPNVSVSGSSGLRWKTDIRDPYDMIGS